MIAKTLVKIWKDYPESRLHCDSMQTGLHTYRIVASLISRDGDEVATVTHHGRGDLNTLKEQAYRLLAVEVTTPVTA